MKHTSLRLTAALSAAIVSLVIATAVPAGAQATASPTRGVGSLLAGLLDTLRGVAPSATPAPPTQTPVVPAPAPTPAAPVQDAAPPPPPASGPATPMAVEQRLADLRYDTGPVDGVFDELGSSAIMAFQKVHGMGRTGELTSQVAADIMATSGVPPALVPNSDANKVEIDLSRQVLFLYEGGSLSRILPVSTGTAATPTPTGSYRIYHRARGWETSRLGRLYNSQYFVGGYAIHGSLSVPEYPASHGCVRLTMSAAEWFPDHVGIGTPVYVLGR